MDVEAGVRRVPVLGPHGDDAFGPDSHWNVVEQRLGKLLLHRLHVLLVQVGPQQTDAAVDVEAHAA